MKILHTADIHLRTTGDQRWHALEAVLERASALDAGVVAISGDLFDRNVDAQQLKTPLRTLFEPCGRTVLLLPGNHDAGGMRAGDYYGANVHVLSRGNEPFDTDQARFVPVPFADGGVDRTLARLHEASSNRAEGRANVLLFHGELMDLVPTRSAFGDEESDYMPVRLASFAGLGFDYVLAGHFHRGYAVHRYDGGYFVYPGSPVSITVKETGQRHADLVELGAAPVPVPLDTFHIETRTVRLDPFDERHPADVIDHALEGLHPDAEVVLTIGGFVNLGRLGMTETELHAAIDKRLARWPIKEVDPRWIDARDVVEHDLFRKFSARLATSGVDGERRAQMQDLVIRSLMELVYAR
jgi:hypothetical protein